MSSDRLSDEPLEFTVDGQDVGKRLDLFLAEHLPRYSRAHLCRVINAAGASVDDLHCKPAYLLRSGQRVLVRLPDLPVEGPVAEDIPLDVLFEDEHLAAINKPAGMVVHPAKGHWQGTLASALAFHFQSLSSVGGATRPGIVHRLDRETSGVIVVAKSDESHLKLARQFAERSAEKEYLAVVKGCPDRDRDMIDRPIGVHPRQREKMAIREGHRTSRHATTFYEVVQRYGKYAQLRVLPKTGRTHQIRVHLTHAGFPILCDRLYSGRARITRHELSGDGSEELLLERAALHARRLKLAHPETGAPIEFVAPLPTDLTQVLEVLEQRIAET
jgi:23S rRNA pseudouridine1911/1915/1917 synthase